MARSERRWGNWSFYATLTVAVRLWNCVGAIESLARTHCFEIRVRRFRLSGATSERTIHHGMLRYYDRP